METTIGGERLGSGSKQAVSVRNYERSTHDLSFVWRSTMAAGTLVPFMAELGLPGDSWDIGLDCDIKTHPTIGPLFGSYKVQLDVFKAPMSLYNAKLNMNLKKVGLHMETIHIPQIELKAETPTIGQDIDNSQINPSCILSYFGIRGLGTILDFEEETTIITRKFNAIKLLAYWDIYGTYYANKQEENGMVIHHERREIEFVISSVVFDGAQNDLILTASSGVPATFPSVQFAPQGTLTIYFTSQANFDPEQTVLWVKAPNGEGVTYPVTQLFSDYVWNAEQNILVYRTPTQIALNTDGFGQWENNPTWYIGGYKINSSNLDPNWTKPQLKSFPLKNIDDMRKDLLSSVNLETAYTITLSTSFSPYADVLDEWDDEETGKKVYSKQFTQEGLGVKTYQSDLFNNWIDTEWLDGDGGINEITAVSTLGGNFTIDELNLAQKLYDYFNRIALSGGTYSDWIDTAYETGKLKRITDPIYIGGLSKELVFQEVVSTAESNSEQPLGTLAGRGVLAQKHKGGYIEAKIDEPSYLIGIISITPRIDYSQGNKWDNNLKTWDDLHKPALDGIGFQELLTDQMAWWDTKYIPMTNKLVKYSAGKQPAWINYMTNVNEVRGNFAINGQQMFMTLNRRYEADITNEGQNVRIKDLTTYIDPSKFNHIFADTRLDAQNFWSQIAIDLKVRRLMSAKIIPNL